MFIPLPNVQCSRGDCEQRPFTYLRTLTYVRMCTDVCVSVCTVYVYVLCMYCVCTVYVYVLCMMRYVLLNTVGMGSYAIHSFSYAILNCINKNRTMLHV